MLLSSHSVVSDSLQPMDCSTLGFPVFHYLPEFIPTHSMLHWIGDAIQPLLPFSPPALNLSLYQFFFPVSWLFASGDQRIGASPSASVLPMNIQDWFPLRLTSLSSLLSKGLSRVFFSTTIWKHQFLTPSLLYGSCTSISDCWKKKYFDSIDLCILKSRDVSWCTCRSVRAFLLRRNWLIISWLQSLSIVILEPK